MCVVSFFLYRLIVVPSTTWGGTYMIYVENPNFNHKFVFLKRAFLDIPESFNTWLTGTGPGTVGSRAANSRAYDSLYKLQGSRLPSFVPPFTSAPAREYFVDLYQKDFATRWWMSVTLAAPFSSLISMYVELGLLGVGLFVGFMWMLQLYFVRIVSYDSEPFFRALGISLYLGTLTILIGAFFDTYLERPLIMGPYWIFAGLVVGRLRFIRGQLRLRQATVA